MVVHVIRSFLRETVFIFSFLKRVFNFNSSFNGYRSNIPDAITDFRMHRLSYNIYGHKVETYYDRFRQLWRYIDF